MARRSSMVIRHAPRLDRAEKTRRVLLTGPEFLPRLAVDERRPALFDGDLVTAFERRAKVSRLGHVLAVRAEAFGDLVITHVFLEQVEAQRHGVATVARPRAPGVVVVYDHDHRHAVFRSGLEFHDRVADARVARDADHRGAFVRGLYAYAVLHRHRRAERVADIRPDRAVLIGAVQNLARPISTQPAAHIPGDAIPAGDECRLLFGQTASIHKIAQLFGDYRRVNGVGITQPLRIMSLVLFFELLPRRRDFRHPCFVFRRRHRVGEGFERRLFATHHPYVYRQVAAYVFGARVDADVFGVRPEGEFAYRRHAVLTDQHDDIGAGESARRGVGRKRTRIRELPLHRA